jgi:hypothetical protein
MGSHIFRGFPGADSRDFRVAGSTVVTKHLGDEVVGSFGAFVDRGYKSVCAVGTLVCGSYGRSRHSSVELGFALGELRSSFRRDCDAVVGGELTLGVGLANHSQAGEEGRHHKHSMSCFHILAFIFSEPALLGLSSVNTPSCTGSLGLLLSKPHPVLRLENDARAAREIFRPREQSPAGRLLCRTADLRPGDCPSARAG